MHNHLDHLAFDLPKEPWMDLPEPVTRALAPLFEVLPRERARACLVVTEAPDDALLGVVCPAPR